MKKKPTHGTGYLNRQNLPDDPEQSRRFEEKARELEAERNREQFEKVIQTIVPKKTPIQPPTQSDS